MPKTKEPYPEPLEIPPSGSEHTHTFILLHGRGSNAERFGRELLSSANLQARLPTVKFVFPTARKRRSTVLRRIPINQWFDNYSLEDPGQRTDLQVDGLSETAEILRGLFEKEALILGGGGYRKIILGGLSQGCAAGIFTLLGGNPEGDNTKTPGAFIGMSGWLPFERQLREILQCDISFRDSVDIENDPENVRDAASSDNGADEGKEEADKEDDSDNPHDDNSSHSFRKIDPSVAAHINQDNFDPFADSDNHEPPLLVQALNHVRDILDLPPLSVENGMSHPGGACDSNTHRASGYYHGKTPVFLGHGSADQKVSVDLGRKMANLLSTGLDMDVTWKAYEDFEHWYKVPDEIDDILSFLQEKIDLPVAEIGQLPQDR